MPAPPLVKKRPAGREDPKSGSTRSRRGVRQGNLPATQPQHPVQASVDFVRPDPLDGDVIMDATARLLAPRTSRLYGESARPAQQAEPKPSAVPSRHRHGKHSGANSQNVPRQAPAPELSHKKTSGAPAPAPKGRNRPANDRRRTEPPRRDTAAEAKGSVMKPYYWNEK